MGADGGGGDDPHMRTESGGGKRPQPPQCKKPSEISLVPSIIKEKHKVVVKPNENIAIISQGMAASDAPAADPPNIPFVVRWAGTDYPMKVPPDATIGYLKRKFVVIEGLASKRQKFKEQTIDAIELHEDRLLSSLSGNTINLIGLGQRDTISYNQIFRAHDTNYKCNVTDKKQPLYDFDGSEVGMSKGIYKSITVHVDCLLKRADEKTPVDRASVELMRQFRHPNSVAIENVYEDGKDLCLILSDSVDGTLAGFIKSGSDYVVDSNAQTLTDVFTNIIIDLCGVLDKLVADGICPKSLSAQNLYLKMVNGKPQLKVLFNKVEPVENFKIDKATQLKNLCIGIKSIISAYVTDENALNAETRRFCEFLGKGAANFFGYNLKNVAQSYPHSWTDEDKFSYLIDLTSSSVDHRPAINKCGIKWPRNAADGEILEEIREIEWMFEDDNRLKQERKHFLESLGDAEAGRIRFHPKWNYDTSYPYDIARLARNLWKHYYTLPWELQKRLGGRGGAFRALERWCPGIWFLVYNAVGPV